MRRMIKLGALVLALVLLLTGCGLGDTFSAISGKQHADAEMQKDTAPADDSDDQMLEEPEEDPEPEPDDPQPNTVSLLSLMPTYEEFFSNLKHFNENAGNMFTFENESRGTVTGSLHPNGDYQYSEFYMYVGSYPIFAFLASYPKQAPHNLCKLSFIFTSTSGGDYDTVMTYIEGFYLCFANASLPYPTFPVLYEELLNAEIETADNGAMERHLQKQGIKYGFHVLFDSSNMVKELIFDINIDPDYMVEVDDSTAGSNRPVSGSRPNLSGGQKAVSNASDGKPTPSGSTADGASSHVHTDACRRWIVDVPYRPAQYRQEKVIDVPYKPAEYAEEIVVDVQFSPEHYEEQLAEVSDWVFVVKVYKHDWRNYSEFKVGELKFASEQEFVDWLILYDYEIGWGYYDEITMQWRYPDDDETRLELLKENLETCADNRYDSIIYILGEDGKTYDITWSKAGEYTHVETQQVLIPEQPEVSHIERMLVSPEQPEVSHYENILVSPEQPEEGHWEYVCGN